MERPPARPRRSGSERRSVGGYHDANRTGFGFYAAKSEEIPGHDRRNHIARKSFTCGWNQGKNTGCQARQYPGNHSVFSEPERHRGNQSEISRRSEERRVGTECIFRWWPNRISKKILT